jgi:hypothetical protein
MIAYSIYDLYMYVRINAHMWEETYLLLFDSSQYWDKAVAMSEVLYSDWPVITCMNVKGGSSGLIRTGHGWGGDYYYRETDLWSSSAAASIQSTLARVGRFMPGRKVTTAGTLSTASSHSSHRPLLHWFVAGLFKDAFQTTYTYVCGVKC